MWQGWEGFILSAKSTSAATPLQAILALDRHSLAAANTARIGRENRCGRPFVVSLTRLNPIRTTEIAAKPL